MSAPRRPSFARDGAGVSEVIGYIFGFLISFIVLVATLYGFGLVAENARALNGTAQMRDVANRVSLGVQEALFVGTTRVGAGPDAASADVRYQRVIFVPTEVGESRYNVSLNNTRIRVQLLDRDPTDPSASVQVPTFNATAVVPAPGNPCTPTYAACLLSGTAVSSAGQINITYLYVRSPIQNIITIS